MNRLLLWGKKYKNKIIAYVFWILVWQALSMVNQEIFLPSPGKVFITLGNLCLTSTFWLTICNSFLKIIGGLFIGIFAGIFLALLTYRVSVLKEIVLLAMNVIKSIPVASFVILALLWVKAQNLSILTSFLLVLPIIYTNVLKGIESTDTLLLEMASVFRMSRMKKIRYLYVPAVLPYFVSAVSVGLGFCWKAGIASEVISIASNTIGGNLYESKIYFNTRELFAWTIVIVCISVLFEKIVLKGIKKLANYMTGIHDGKRS